MNDYKSKYWCHKTKQSHVSFCKPSLRIKLNVIISVDRLIAFEISCGSHKAEDVSSFISKVMVEESRKAKSNCIKFVVLDSE